MRVEAINGFVLPSKEEISKLKIEQYVGFLSRKSRAFFEFKNPKELKLLDYKTANNIFMSWVTYAFGEKSEVFNILNEFKSKIERLSNSDRSESFNIICHINEVGKKLIEDYNYDYYYSSKNPCIYNTKPQVSLLKLEQLFIQHEIPSCYLEELIKPSATLIYGRNAFNWIKNITNMNIEKVNLLKEYLDEYFQYLLDKPKSILKINNLDLPFDRNQISLTCQYASYLNRNSTVVISSYSSKLRLVKNEQSNDNFMSWFRSIYLKNSKEVVELENYRYNIENLSKSVINLGNKLIDNYNYEKKSKYTEQQQCLINLEQFLIRYNLPPEYVFDSIEKKKNYILNEEVIEWIYKITNKKKEKTKYLYKYLDEYFKHVFKQSKDKVIVNFIDDFRVDKTFSIIKLKKENNKFNTI